MLKKPEQPDLHPEELLKVKVIASKEDQTALTCLADLELLLERANCVLRFVGSGHELKVEIQSL